MYNKWKTARERGVKALQNQGKCDKLTVKDGWLLCPVCGKHKVLRLTPGTTAKDLPVYCKRCGQESIVNIDQSLSQRRETSA